MPTILLIGEDAVLLRTRAAVLSQAAFLRQTGAEIEACEPRAALAARALKQYDVVLLCHSLSEARSASLAAAIRKNSPKTKILQVSSDRVLGTVVSTKLADAISSWEPERLIGRTVELLNAASTAQPV